MMSARPNSGISIKLSRSKGWDAAHRAIRGITKILVIVGGTTLIVAPCMANAREGPPIKLCNWAPYAIEAAETYVSSPNVWVTDGWFVLQAGTCTDGFVGSSINAINYIHVEPIGSLATRLTKEGSRIDFGGDHQYCVTSGTPFSFVAHSNCGSNEKLASFSTVDAGDFGSINWPISDSAWPARNAAETAQQVTKVQLFLEERERIDSVAAVAEDVAQGLCTKHDPIESSQKSAQIPLAGYSDLNVTYSTFLSAFVFPATPDSVHFSASTFFNVNEMQSKIGEALSAVTHSTCVDRYNNKQVWLAPDPLQGTATGGFRVTYTKRVCADPLRTDLFTQTVQGNLVFTPSVSGGRLKLDLDASAEGGSLPAWASGLSKVLDVASFGSLGKAIRDGFNGQMAQFAASVQKLNGPLYNEKVLAKGFNAQGVNLDRTLFLNLEGNLTLEVDASADVPTALACDVYKQFLDYAR